MNRIIEYMTTEALTFTGTTRLFQMVIPFYNPTNNEWIFLLFFTSLSVCILLGLDNI